MNAYPNGEGSLAAGEVYREALFLCLKAMITERRAPIMIMMSKRFPVEEGSPMSGVRQHHAGSVSL